MRPTRPYRSVLIFAILAFVCLGALWGTAKAVAPSEPGTGAGAASPGLAAPDPPPSPYPPGLRAATEPLRGAADHLRARRCAEALTAVAAAGPRSPSLPGADAATAFHATVEGLYAHACDDPQRAVQRLSSGAAPTSSSGMPTLEDWRLLVLADSAAALGRDGQALGALERLLGDHPASPLRPRAYVRAAHVAAGLATGDRLTGPAAVPPPDRAGAVAALALVARARTEGIDGAAAADLESLAWEIGAALGDSPTLATAGRRLLVHHPARARELGVMATLVPAAALGAGTAPPAVHAEAAVPLSVEERLLRSRNLVDAGRAEDARRALAAVREADRDLEWRLLTARVLIAEDDGLAALRLLASEAPSLGGPLPHPDRALVARVEWYRALAAFEAARTRRGRPSLPSDERRRLRDEGLEHLAAAAGPGAEPEVARRALGRLFSELWEEERVDAGLAVLARLRALDPEDLSGTRALWQAGWSRFEGGDPSGAIGFWAELLSLYPESAYSRNARYWTARAHEALGHAERAKTIYGEVLAVETGDFYTRYARERLERLAGGGVADPVGSPLAEDRGTPWPEHPDFHRARLLSDLGLDDLALSELATLAQPASGETPDRRRAGAALEARILARAGDPRASIRRIHDAFPSLGGPLQGTAPAAALRLYYPLAYGEVIEASARRQALPPHLVLGMVRQESGFDTEAVSRAGARGLMQLMPATGREVAGKLGLSWSASRLTDPAFNTALGTAYFRQVLEMFDGDVELALAGYNGGPYRIRRLWRQAPHQQGRDVFLEGLPVAESRVYVKRILLLADSYRQLYPSVAAEAGS